MSNIDHIVRDYLQTWNERDPAKRGAGIAALFAEGCTYTDPMARVAGRAGLDDFIAAVQRQFAGVAFVLAGTVDAHHDVARFTWHAVAPGSSEPLAIGFDVMVVDGGRIAQVVGFLDKAPAR